MHFEGQPDHHVLCSKPCICVPHHTFWCSLWLADAVPRHWKCHNDTCGGFCDWKAWCPHWWNWRLESGTLGKDDFSDSVILLHHFDDNTGSGVAEICEPADITGRVMPTGLQIPISFDGRGKEALQELLSTGHQGPIFVGSVMTNRSTWRVGHWCDVLPWSPIADA